MKLRSNYGFARRPFRVQRQAFANLAYTADLDSAPMACCFDSSEGATVSMATGGTLAAQQCNRPSEPCQGNLLRRRLMHCPFACLKARVARVSLYAFQPEFSCSKYQFLQNCDCENFGLLLISLPWLHGGFLH